MGNFIYQIEKNELEDHLEIIFYIKNTKNNTIIEKIHLPYLIYAEKDKFNNLNFKSDKIFLSTDEYIDKNGLKVQKIEIKNKELYEYIKDLLKDNQINVYEADLIKEHRYLIDNQIPILYDDKTSLQAPKPLNLNKSIDLKYISIDIETIGTFDNQEIIMISSYSPNSSSINKVYVNQSNIKNKLKLLSNLPKNLEYEIIFLKSESEVLTKFRDDIIAFQPQLIVGWNVIDFDFKVIKDRMKYYSIDFKFSKFEGETKLKLNKDFFRDSTMTSPGTIVIDIISLLKSSYITFEDYKLNTVAKEVLGDSKIDIEDDNKEDMGIENKLKDIETMLINNPFKLIDYNFKDSKLVSQIISKLKLLELLTERSIITETPLMKVKSPIATLDIMYLKKLHLKNIVADSNFNYTSSNPIEGAFVFEPQPGFYEDIFVFDFKSLYPSIIMTFNIDPFTYSDSGTIIAPNNAKFSSKPGILPELILKLYKQRDIAKQQNNDIKSYALKITMNSFYGAMASPKSRLHNKEIGGAITSFARHIIQKAQKYVEGKGHKVIYGDTDSIFVKIRGHEGKTIECKKKVGLELQNQLNNYFKTWVEQQYKCNNYLIIEMEKIYSKFFIASKKRYVGHDLITNKTKFIGMEAIRGDWTDLARDFQIQLVNIIFKNNDNQQNKKQIIKFILEEIEKLKSGKYDHKLIYKKKTTKALSEYTKMTPPHVKAAREVKNFSGRLVKYVMLESGPKHISKLSNLSKPINYDYSHYIEKQLKGVSDDLLEKIGLDFDEIINSKKQTSLNKFF